MPPPESVEQHWAYRATWWVLHHGDQLLAPGLVLCVLLAAVCLVLVWAQAGARWIVVYWVWRGFLRGLRSRSRSRHPGGGGGHSAEYEAVMRSAGWRRRRAQTIRRAGRRCQECGAGGPLDVHHLTYQHLGDERPWELVAVCERCHQQLHAR